MGAILLAGSTLSVLVSTFSTLDRAEVEKFQKVVFSPGMRQCPRQIDLEVQIKKVRSTRSHESPVKRVLGETA